MSEMMYRKLMVGKHLKVVHSTNPCDLSVAGRVVDETRNMIQVEDKKVKWLIKKNVIVLVNGQKIDGKELVGRPDERIKR